MIRVWIAKNEVIVMLLAVAIISAVVYLPLVGSIGYLNDDWYLMYSARAYGPNAFINIFSIDRLTSLAESISADPYLSLQVCRNLRAVSGLSTDVIETIVALYCPE